MDGSEVPVPSVPEEPKLKEAVGNIWSPLWESGGIPVWRVIPTNGSVNQKGLAVMGRGVALQATQRFPEIRLALAHRLKRGGNHVYPFQSIGLITFPVKHRWMESANPTLIRRSLRELAELAADPQYGLTESGILIPRVGCGNGRLKWADIKPIVEEELASLPGVVVVTTPMDKEREESSL